MRILVTGATGFVGPHLVKRLADLGHEVVGTHEKPRGPEGYRLLDLMDESSIESAVRGSWDWVIHLAGISGTKEAKANPKKAWNVNVVGTQALIASLAKLVTKPSLLLVSSADVYGEGGSTKSLESDLIAPSSLYAATKAASEVVARVTCPPAGIGFTIARPWPHTGPDQQDDRLLTRWMKELNEGSREVRADPDIVRDYLHVHDVVDSYCTLIDNKPLGETYNIASGQGLKFEVLFEKLCRTMEVEARLIRPDVPSDGAKYSVGDPGKVRRDTGWMVKRSVDQAIDDLVKSRMNAKAN